MQNGILYLFFVLPLIFCWYIFKFSALAILHLAKLVAVGISYLVAQNRAKKAAAFSEAQPPPSTLGHPTVPSDKRTEGNSSETP